MVSRSGVFSDFTDTLVTESPTTLEVRGEALAPYTILVDGEVRAQTTMQLDERAFVSVPLEPGRNEVCVGATGDPQRLRFDEATNCVTIAYIPR